jgi:hypothetical protein
MPCAIGRRSIRCRCCASSSYLHGSSRGPGSCTLCIRGTRHRHRHVVAVAAAGNGNGISTVLWTFPRTKGSSQIRGQSLPACMAEVTAQTMAHIHGHFQESIRVFADLAPFLHAVHRLRRAARPPLCAAIGLHTCCIAAGMQVCWGVGGTPQPAAPRDGVCQGVHPAACKRPNRMSISRDPACRWSAMPALRLTPFWAPQQLHHTKCQRVRR